MKCEKVKIGDGFAFVCAGGRRGPRTTCLWCPAAAPLLCDWKTGAGKTCDKPICGKHAKEVAPDKHVCPEHRASYDRWLARKAAA